MLSIVFVWWIELVNEELPFNHLTTNRPGQHSGEDVPQFHCKLAYCEDSMDVQPDDNMGFSGFLETYQEM